jgi:hypothetical protein
VGSVSEAELLYDGIKVGWGKERELSNSSVKKQPIGTNRLN